MGTPAWAMGGIGVPFEVEGHMQGWGIDLILDHVPSCCSFLASHEPYMQMICTEMETRRGGKGGLFGNVLAQI